MTYKLVYTNELYHHGVKGQKWGVRKERQPSGGDSSGKKRGLSKKQKIALGVAAVAVTTAVLYKTGSFDKMADAGRHAANNMKARKLGLELVQNSEKTGSSSNFDKAMSRMNEAFSYGLPNKSNPKEISNITQINNSLKVKRPGPPGGARLTYASNRLMTKYGAANEAAIRNHQKADKLSRDIFNNRVTDVVSAAEKKRRFDSKGDAAARKALEIYKNSMNNNKLPGYYSKRKVPSLSSNRSFHSGKNVANKLTSSNFMRNLTYSDLEKLDLF